MQRVEPERTLTDAQRDEFEDMLRALTLERSQIKEAMGFSLDNADAAGEVVLLLCTSVTAMPSVCLSILAHLLTFVHYSIPISLGLGLTFGVMGFNSNDSNPSVGLGQPYGHARVLPCLMSSSNDQSMYTTLYQNRRY